MRSEPNFFEHKDLRWRECADPSPEAAIWRHLKRHAVGFSLAACAALILYFTNVAVGFRSGATVSGAVSGLAVSHDTFIARDGRGVPHIRASNLHDLFFAQGFAEASDRLFQMDITRRYAYGRLAEIFGEKALPLDEYTRAVDIAGIAERQWQSADASTKTAIESFSAGVNAAVQSQPLPVEFRMLLYRPARWVPQDSIAVSIVAALELSDSWSDVLMRNDAWHDLGARCFNAAFPLSDSRYDVTFRGIRAIPRTGNENPGDCPNLARGSPSVARPRIGSNAWAAAASQARNGHALLANDPHVDLTIPGIWYVMDLHAPEFHAAGAVLPGMPGIVLGHNERLAWGATNAEAATTVVYKAATRSGAQKVIEAFHVRFARPRWKEYYRTRTEFSVDTESLGMAFVRWPVYWQRRTSITTILSLDRSQTIDEATRALNEYRGAPENFILADSSGRIAYHLAGLIPNDSAWGRYVHPARDLTEPLRTIPFADLPQQNATANGVVLSANNRMYGAHYDYRLSAAFEPPYRAYRIASLLRRRSAYDVSFFREMQLDTYSPIEAEIVDSALHIDRDDAMRDVAHSRQLLDHWDGRFDPDSRAASLAHDVTIGLEAQETSLALLLERLRAKQHSYDSADQIHTLLSAEQPQTWATHGAVEVVHPLSVMWYGLLQGHALPGDGDEFTIHLQSPGFAQGFRAVWSVGDWDAGGISIPSGESGEPSSGHYDDRAPAWIAGTLEPLPFSNTAVSKATTATLRLSK